MFWMPTGYGRAPSASPFPLTISDLYSQSQEPDYPQPPQLISDASGLPGEQQRQLKREALLRMIAAGLAQTGRGQGKGQMGTAMLAAVAGGNPAEQEAVDRANQLAQQKFGFERQRAALQAETARTRQVGARDQRTAQSALTAAQDLWTQADGDPAFQQRVAVAAQRGPDAMEELAKLQAALPGRKALKAAGVDPDNPQAVAEAQAKAKLAAEQAQKEADLAAQNRAWMDLERQKRSEKLGDYKPPPPDKPHESARVIGDDGKVYLIDPFTGRQRGVADLPVKVKTSNVGLDPWEESLREAQRQAQNPLAGMTPQQMEELANRLYALRTKGPGATDASGAKILPVPSGGRVAPGPKPAPKPKPDNPNARLIPAAGVVGKAARDFSGVADPKARAWAEQQLAAGVPRSTIEAQLKKWGAL